MGMKDFSNERKKVKNNCKKGNQEEFRERERERERERQGEDVKTRIESGKGKGGRVQMLGVNLGRRGGSI